MRTTQAVNKMETEANSQERKTGSWEGGGPGSEVNGGRKDHGFGWEGG